MAVPSKTKSRADGVDLRCGDSIEGMRGLPSDSVSLVIADPPYNFGVAYRKYDDRLPEAAYVAWTRRWLREAARCLDPHGSMWVFTPDEWLAEIDLYCRKTLNLFRRHMICWTFTFGQAAQRGFTRSKLFILHVVKSKARYTFNADAVRVPSARQLVYGDKRANAKGKLPDDTWCLLKAELEQRLPPGGDVWSQSRVCGTHRERQRQVANQIPLPIVERIIRATSNPGDLVIDPFLGSGTSAEACVRLGRRFIGWDLDEDCVASGWERVARATQGRAAEADQMELFSPPANAGKGA